MPHSLHRQRGAQKLPVAPQHLSLLPSRLKLSSTKPPQPPLPLPPETTVPPRQSHSLPPALALGQADGSVPPSVGRFSRPALTQVEQATNSSDHITCVAGRGGAQRLGCGSMPFGFTDFSAQGAVFGNRVEKGQATRLLTPVHLGRRLGKGAGRLPAAPQPQTSVVWTEKDDTGIQSLEF